MSNAENTNVNSSSLRIVALDFLRGADIFFLIFIGPLGLTLCREFNLPAEDFLRGQLQHCSWSGFSTWDLIMPLFMFLAGASIPFAVANHQKQNWGYGHLWLRLLKRVLILWILGGIVQGNFLALNPNRIYLYTNTLQSIAMGCLIAYPIVVFGSIRTQVIALAVLLLGYWGFFLCDGNVTAQGVNIAERVDMACLGRFRDGARLLPNGTVQFAGYYHYAWILPSLAFGAITLMGALSAQVLRMDTPALRKVKILLLTGALCVVFGWLWHLLFPVIKPLFTSSMVLVAGGFSLLLLGGFYAITDVWQWTRGIGFFRVIGYNSLLAYCVSEMHLLNRIAPDLLFGLKQYVGPSWYAVIVQCGTFLIVYALLWLLYKQKLSIRA